MKLSGDEFYELTPRQLDALLKRHKSHTASTELLFGQIVSAIYSTGFRSPDKPTSPLDFMPSQWAKKSASNSDKSPSAPVRMTKKKRAVLSTNLNMVLMQLARKA